MQYLRDLDRLAFANWNRRLILATATIAAAVVLTLVAFARLFRNPVDLLYSLGLFFLFPFPLYTSLSPYFDWAASGLVHLLTGSRSRDLSEALIRWTLWSLYPVLVLAITFIRTTKIARFLYVALLALLILNVAGCIRAIDSMKAIP